MFDDHRMDRKGFTYVTDFLNGCGGCVQETIEDRKNSCELFGYDFVIDENLKVRQTLHLPSFRPKEAKSCIPNICEQ